jgi:hypothetical protein
MAEYHIREEKRAAVEESIDGWLQLEGIQHLEVCRKRGNSHSKIVDSEVDAEELEQLGCGEAVLDRVLDQMAGQGGRFELRLRFADYAAKGGRSDLTKAFHLVRVKEVATKSQGSSAATEQLATSLATAFDQQSARAESRDERHADFLSQMMLRQDESSERRLSEHASYQIEIMRLRDELARKDLEMALVEAQQGMPPELWAEVLKAGMPVVGQLVGAVSTAVSRWGASYAPAGGALSPPQTPPAAVSETPPAQPEQQPTQPA